MVDRRLEEHGRRSVGIVGGEGERELECEVRVGCIVRSFYCCGPGEKVAICGREGGDAWGGGCHKLHELGL